MYKLAREILKELKELNKTLKVIAYPEKSMITKQLEEMLKKNQT